MIYSLFVQSLAILALFVWMFSYHFKERKHILFFQLFSFIFWAAHFLLLGAYVGAVLLTVGVLRISVFYFKTKDNWIRNPLVLLFFIILLGILTLLTATNYWAIFAFIGGSLATIATWQDKQENIRKVFIPSHISWIVYDIFVGSYGGAITEVVLGVSVLLSLYRGDKKSL